MREIVKDFFPEGRGSGSPTEKPPERRWLRVGDLVRIEEHKKVGVNLIIGYGACPNTIGAVSSLNIGKLSGDARCTEEGCHFVQKRVTLEELIRG